MTMQILLCDTEPMIHDLVTDYLSPLGFKLTFARSAGQCLEMIDKKIPDVILIDTHLPSFSGAQTLNQIRQKGLKTPVILVGSNYGVTSFEEATALGANGFIEKPFKLKIFLEQVLAVLPN